MRGDYETLKKGEEQTYVRAIAVQVSVAPGLLAAVSHAGHAVAFLELGAGLLHGFESIC